MSSSQDRKLSLLESLPTELTENIAAHLDDKSLIAFAATSRTINADTKTVYGERFFAELKFCLHPRSLKVLSAISESQYAERVTSVLFITKNFAHADPTYPMSDGWYVDARYCEQPDGEYMQGTYAELVKRTIELDSKTIADALSSLPKLRAVIAGDIDLGDWSTFGTRRDA